MSDLVFYTNPQSRGRIVRWMLEETGADYETKLLGYADSMKGADYLAISQTFQILGELTGVERNQDGLSGVSVIVNPRRPFTLCL